MRRVLVSAGLTGLAACAPSELGHAGTPTATHLRVAKAPSMACTAPTPATAPAALAP